MRVWVKGKIMSFHRRLWFYFLLAASFLKTTTMADTAGEPQLKGYCLSSDGQDQNSGTSHIVAESKDDCYSQCKAVPQATGCEFSQSSGSCIYHTQDVASGSGSGGSICWVFHSSTGTTTTTTTTTTTSTITTTGLRCSGVDNGCCTAETPCKEGDGDCDSDNHCEGELICGRDNCPWGDSDDCCQKKQPGFRCGGVDKGCCTAENPCKEGDGDCDSDNQCEGGLTCGTDNCSWGEEDDCCHNAETDYQNCVHNPEHDGCMDIINKYLPGLMEAGAIGENQVGNITSKPTSKDASSYLKKWGKTLLPVTDSFEGKQIKDKKVTNEMISIDGTVKGYIGENKKRWYGDMRYRPTGLYAEAGEIVTIIIPEKLSEKVGVYIGHKEFQIYFPPSKNPVKKIASPYGGLIILKITKNLGKFEVKVNNAIKAPTFIQGVNTNEEWNDEIKHYSPKWALLRVPRQVDIYVQTLKIKNITDMNATMSRIKKTMDALEDMVGLPPNSKPGADVWVFNPAMGGGYRDGTCSPGWSTNGDSLYTKVDDTLDTYYDDLFKNFGTNGVALHEAGHGYCYSDLPGEGQQWTAETVRRYIEWKTGFEARIAAKDQETIDLTISENLDFGLIYRMVLFKMYSNGSSCGTAKFDKKQLSTYSTYDVCYRYLNWVPSKAHGWDTFKDVRTLNAKKKRSYGNSFDRLIDLHCKVTKHNMLPFFDIYNLKPNDRSIGENCAKLPHSERIGKWLDIVNCTIESMTTNGMRDMRNCSDLDFYPEHKGVCMLSGLCEKDGANCEKDGKNCGHPTRMNDKFDIWGSHLSSGSMMNCLKRAEDNFKDCKNSKKNKITATYYDKKFKEDYKYTYPSSVKKLWRDDLRCGESYPLPDGKPGQCDPTARYHCCSRVGWCGNTDDHCKCSSCVNYKEKHIMAMTSPNPRKLGKRNVRAGVTKLKIAESGL